MKTKFKFLVLLPFFALLLFTSCQEEEVFITPPDETEALAPSSELTSFLSATSKNDGSKDNIIDGTSCISVKLPVVVKVRGIEIRIDSEADYIKIKRLYNEVADDIDRLDIIFPITIITSDHEEITIESAEALSEFIAECKGDDEEEEEEIRCIDFKFPISFSVFDRDFNIIETVEIENDKQLHRFMKRVKNADVFASLNYPVNMVLKDGTVLTAENNEQLREIIKAAKDSCEEEDDFSKERLENYLKKCPWIVYEFKRDNQDATDAFSQYAINFKDDGVVTMRARNGDVLTGEWELERTRRGIVLDMEFENLADFTLKWLLYDFEDGKIKIYEEGGNRIILKRNCDVIVDITKERVENFLKECLWRVARLQVDGAENEKEYIGTPLKFFGDNVVKIRINGELVQGTYEVLVRPGVGIGLEINLEGRPDLKLQWVIKFLGEDLIKLYNVNNEMILKRDCPDDDVNYITEVLTNGVWEVASYMVLDADLTPNYDGYVIGFNENGKLFAEGQGNNYVGSWHGYRYEGLNLGLNFRTDDAPFFELRHRWKIKEVTPNRIELKDYDSNGEIERVLVLEKTQ